MASRQHTLGKPPLVPGFSKILESSLCAAKTDWLNFTGAETAPNIAEIYVLDDGVNLVLENYVGDLAFFSDLVPDDWLKDRGDDRPAFEQRRLLFSALKFDQT